MADEAETITTETTETPTTEVVADASAGTATGAATGTAAADDTADEGTLLGGKPAETEAKADEPVGAPEAYDLKAPDGQGFDTEAFAVAEPVLRDLGLTNEQAQKLVDVYPVLMQRASDAAGKQVISEVVATRKAWADAAHADPEIGGTPEHRDAVMATAAKALDRFAGPEFRSFLNETGLGNHPDMVRFAYRAGKAISEDNEFHRADAAAPDKPRTLAERLYARPAATT